MRKHKDVPRVIAVTNQKGGVAKSTTVLNLGAVFADEGRRTLLIDLDPHAGLTFSLGFDDPERAFERTAYDVLDPEQQVPIREAAVETKIPRLSLVPSNLRLVEIDYRLVGRPGWAQILKRRIADAGDTYDVVLLDCPPSLGVLTRMALVAAELALVPVQAEFLALRGLTLLNQVVEETKSETDHAGLQVRYLLTMHTHTKHSEEIQADIRKHFGDQVFETVIRRSVKFPDSTLAGVPILLFDRDHHGSEAYRSLAKEIAYAQPANLAR